MKLALYALCALFAMTLMGIELPEAEAGDSCLSSLKIPGQDEVMANAA